MIFVTLWQFPGFADRKILDRYRLLDERSLIAEFAVDQETLADFARCCENRLFIAW